jgi:thiosulfate dehydrogenase [quinone] large subunit
VKITRVNNARGLNQVARIKRSPATALRMLFGVVWLVDAFFKWQPGFRDSFSGVLRGMVTSQPGIIRPWFQFWALLATHTGQLLPDMTAITETAIGVALIVGVARRPVYIIGALYALFVWAVGEGFGGPYALGISTDVGAALIYTFVFASLFILESPSDVRVLSLQRITVPASRRLDPRLAQASLDETAALEALRNQAIKNAMPRRGQM